MRACALSAIQNRFEEGFGSRNFNSTSSRFLENLKKTDLCLRYQDLTNNSASIFFLTWIWYSKRMNCVLAIFSWKLSCIWLSCWQVLNEGELQSLAKVAHYWFFLIVLKWPTLQNAWEKRQEIQHAMKIWQKKGEGIPHRWSVFPGSSSPLNILLHQGSSTKEWCRWFLKPEPCSCLLGHSWAVPEEGPALCWSQTIRAQGWDGCYLRMGRIQQLSASLIQLSFVLTLRTSVWQLVTVTLSARCQGTGKPGRMKPFEVLTQTLIKCPGWAFIPPLDPWRQLLNCLCFLQMCYFIMMPPGLYRRAVIIFIV